MQLYPDARELLLIGGGHAHVSVLRSFGMRPLPGLRITVVARELHTPYSGMLPGLIAGHYGFDDIHIDLGPLVTFAGGRLIHGEVAAVEPDERRVCLGDGRELRYDLLSINTGIVPSLDGTRGAREYSVPVKPIGRFLPAWRALLREIEDSPTVERSLVVVGGGAGGVELALAAAYRLRGASGVVVHLVTADPAIVPGFNRRARRRLGAALLRAGIDVRTDFRVVEVTPSSVRSQDGRELAANHVLWTTHAGAPEFPAAAGLACDPDGFIEVDAELTSISHSDVFAVGDVAHLRASPRPKAGVFAVRAGPVLADNLRAAALGQPLRPFRPQHRFLALVATGDGSAIANRGAWSAEGRWVWRWKDWIDRRFMRRFSDLPEVRVMAPAAARIPLPGGDDAGMRCGGCGSKLGADLLEATLRRIAADRPSKRPGRSPIRIGLEARDDAAVITPGRGHLVLSVDGFRSFVSDPWVFGRLAAVHALGDVYAMGGRPRGALALATVPLAAEALMADDLYQMMCGALDALAEAGAALLGGHSAEGIELSLGFSVLGRLASEGALTKAGMQTGQALILTQALGTGALFAAAARGRARSRWLVHAQAEMGRLPARAAEILVAHGATAMTDVTGFGLLGHLAEMVRASGRAVDLAIDRLPALPGALEVLGAGTRSTLHRNNAGVLVDFELHGVTPDDVRLDLAVDPQTCGGLLASVPMERAGAAVDALREAGHADAVVIGRVEGRARAGASGRVVGGRDGA